MKTLIQLSIILTFFSCSTNQLTEGQKMREELHQTTTEHRNIVGYETGTLFKNRVYYKVTDSEGKPALRVYKPRNEELKPVGSILLIDNFYTLQH